MQGNVDFIGAGSRSRTDTSLRTPDFETYHFPMKSISMFNFSRFVHGRGINGLAAELNAFCLSAYQSLTYVNGEEKWMSLICMLK